MARACGHVGEGRPLRTLEIAPEEAPWLAALSPLTAKPVLYVANVAEDGFGGNPFAEAVEARARAEGAAAVRVCAATEAELGRLDEAGRAAIGGNGLAGLGGRALKPVALGHVRQLRSLLPGRVAVVGVGGVFCGRDATDFFRAGASGVQVGTACYAYGPGVFQDIVSEFLDLAA